MRKGLGLLVSSVIVTALLIDFPSAQTHVLFGDLIVHDEEESPNSKSAFRVILTSITGTVVGRLAVTNGGRYRFLGVANGDYILTVEFGTQEVARLNLLINELRPTDIQKNLELEWTHRFPAASPERIQNVLYARNEAEQDLYLNAQEARQIDDLKRAEELLLALTARDSGDYEAWAELGTIRFQRKRLKEAEQAYRKAISIQPELIVAHYNLGKLYFQQGKFEASITELEQVLTQAPRLAEAHLLLGESYLQLKMGSRAVPHLEKALELEPDKMADAHLRLATLYRAAGYSHLAVPQYRLYLRKRPDAPGKKEIEKFIKQGPPSH